MRIAVAGVGLIGGSIGLAAGEYVDSEVVGFDVDPGALEAALDRGALDRAAGSLAEALAGADACFLCAPVRALPELVGRALEVAPEDCVVSDVGSTKRPILAAAEDRRFVGGHPIAGAETAGVERARADLFQGAAWYLTPRASSSGILYERLHRLIVSFGALPAAIDAEAHDRLLATVSHLPHVLANVLVGRAAERLSEENETLPRVGPSFRDATRVAGSNPSIWTDIFLSNREAIAEDLEETIEDLRALAATLRAGDEPALEAWNAAARERRDRLLGADLVGGPVHELRVSVPNRPGIVAEVALALGRAGVNIVDMALAPAPDMRSGSITLWVAGAEAATRAEELIAELGFPVARGS